MNTKAYVGTFPEIADLDKSSQEALLERARYEAFAVQGMSGKFAVHLVISFLIAFVIAMPLSYLADFTMLASALGVGIGGFFLHFICGNSMPKYYVRVCLWF